MPSSPAIAGLDQTPLTELHGVGPSYAQRLAKLGLHTVQDLLFHLPLRYQDRTRVTPIGSLRPGDQAVVDSIEQGDSIETLTVSGDVDALLEANADRVAEWNAVLD